MLLRLCGLQRRRSCPHTSPPRPCPTQGAAEHFPAVEELSSFSGCWKQDEVRHVARSGGNTALCITSTPLKTLIKKFVSRMCGPSEPPGCGLWPRDRQARCMPVLRLRLRHKCPIEPRIYINNILFNAWLPLAMTFISAGTHQGTCAPVDALYFTSYQSTIVMPDGPAASRGHSGSPTLTWVVHLCGTRPPSMVGVNMN